MDGNWRLFAGWLLLGTVGCSPSRQPSVAPVATSGPVAPVAHSQNDTAPATATPAVSATPPAPAAALPAPAAAPPAPATPPTPSAGVRAELSPGTARVLPVNREIRIRQDISFKYRSDQLDPESMSQLDEVASLLQKQSELRIGVQGHADHEGSSAQNERLSQQRAEVVARYLVEHGVDQARLEVEALSDRQPRADPRFAEGRARNRRVEFRILNPEVLRRSRTDGD